MADTVAQLLDRREEELLQLIAKLHRELVPLQAELAKVRRAKAAMEETDFEPTPPDFGRTDAQLEFGPVTLSAYGHFTMKQLAVKALTEQFREGATANQLRAFFKHAWGRDDVSRASLSPQLSRLKQEGIITRRGKLWRLAEP